MPWRRTYWEVARTCGLGNGTLQLSGCASGRGAGTLGHRSPLRRIAGDVFAITTVDFTSTGTTVNVPTTDYSPGASPIPLHTTAMWVMRVK